MNLMGRLSYEGNVSGKLGAELVADVEANPSGSATQTLVKIRVGDIIYSIPTGGGGGGVSSYSLLTDKPKINNHTINGEMTSEDLDLQDKIIFPGDGSKYLDGNGEFSTPAVGVNYSTSEQNTGLKWIDGKDIFFKAYETTVNDENNKQIDTMVNDDINVLPMSSSSVKTTGQYNTQFGTNVIANAPVRIVVNYLGVFTNLENYNSIFGTVTIRVILYYTKNI